MIVNEHNYAEFILDYYEGRLSTARQQQLLEFLALHPQFRKEFEEYEHMGLADEGDNIFPGKQELKKRTTLSGEEIFELSEGIVSEEEKAERKRILSGNAALEKELRQWQAARVQADANIVYPDKEELKRPLVVPLWQNIYWRAAAGIALLLGLGWIYLAQQNGNSVSGIAFNGQNSATAPALHKNVKATAAAEDTQAAHPEISPQRNPHIPAAHQLFVQQQNNKMDSASLRLNTPADTGTIKNVIVKIDSLRLRPVVPGPVQPDSISSAGIAQHTAADSLPRQELHGVWGPEEDLQPKKSLKRKVLDLAVTCLQGLKKIGVKKADAVKKTDPQSGNTDYILVFGKRSYSTSE